MAEERWNSELVAKLKVVWKNFSREFWHIKRTALTTTSDILRTLQLKAVEDERWSALLQLSVHIVDNHVPGQETYAAKRLRDVCELTLGRDTLRKEYFYAVHQLGKILYVLRPYLDGNFEEDEGMEIYQLTATMVELYSKICTLRYIEEKKFRSVHHIVHPIRNSVLIRKMGYVYRLCSSQTHTVILSGMSITSDVDVTLISKDEERECWDALMSLSEFLVHHFFTPEDSRSHLFLYDVPGIVFTEEDIRTEYYNAVVGLCRQLPSFAEHMARDKGVVVIVGIYELVGTMLGLYQRACTVREIERNKRMKLLQMFHANDKPNKPDNPESEEPEEQI